MRDLVVRFQQRQRQVVHNGLRASPHDDLFERHPVPSRERIPQFDTAAVLDICSPAPPRRAIASRAPAIGPKVPSLDASCTDRGSNRRARVVRAQPLQRRPQPAGPDLPHVDAIARIPSPWYCALAFDLDPLLIARTLSLLRALIRQQRMDPSCSAIANLSARWPAYARLLSIRNSPCELGKAPVRGSKNSKR